MKKISLRRIFLAICCPIGVCLLILLREYLSDITAAYEASHPYSYGPAYAAKVVMIFLWAALGRIMLAVLRKPYIYGKLRIDVCAVFSTCILLIFGMVSLLSGSFSLLLNQTFDVAFVFSALCIIGRASS